MRNFNPGSFRYTISFLQPPTGKDGYGELQEKWTTYRTVKASIAPILGNELYTALSTESKMEVKFRTRFIQGVANKMRIQHGTDIYEILSAIDPNMSHKELLCYCKKVDV